MDAEIKRLDWLIETTEYKDLIGLNELIVFEVFNFFILHTLVIFTSSLYDYTDIIFLKVGFANNLLS